MILVIHVPPFCLHVAYFAPWTISMANSSPQPDKRVSLIPLHIYSCSKSVEILDEEETTGLGFLRLQSCGCSFVRYMSLSTSFKETQRSEI